MAADGSQQGRPIPEAAKRYLLTYPGLAADFDAKYGAGSAAQVLNPRKQSTRPLRPITDRAKQRLLSNPQLAGDFDAMFGPGQAQLVLSAPPERGVLATVGDTLKGAARGPINAVNETLDLLDSGAKALGARFGDIRYDSERGLRALSPEEVQAEDNPNGLTSLVTGQKSPVPQLGPRVPNLDAPESVPGQLAQGVTQFITGLAGLGKFTKLAKLDGFVAAGGKLADATVRSAIVAGTMFDPYDGNVANFVERYPSLQTPLTEYLAVGDDDSEAEARMKNAVADVVVGVPLQLVMTGLKGLRAAKQGRLEDAERHIEELADAEAREGSQEAATGAPEAKVDLPQGNPSADPVAPPSATQTPKVEALVSSVEGAPARSASAADAAAQVAKDAPVIPKAPVRLTPEVAKEIGDTIRGTVRAGDSLDELQRTTGANGWDGFFNGKSGFNVEKWQQTAGTDARAALGILEDIGEQFAEQIDEVRGGATKSFGSMVGEASRLAQLTGNDPGAFLNMLTADAKNVKSVAGRLVGYRNFTLSLATDVKRLAQMIDQGSPGQFGTMDNLTAEFARRTEFLANAQALTKAVQSGTARAVTSGRLGAKISPAMSKAIESGKFNGATAMDSAAAARLAKAIAGSDEAGVLQATRLSGMDRLGEAVSRYWINSILSGPATHVVNATSNFLKGATQAGEQYLAGVYSGDARVRRIAAHTMAEMTSQTVDAWKVARKALNQGDNILDPSAQIGDRSLKQVSADEIATALENGQYGAAVLKAGDALFNYPTRLLASSDEFFKQIAYRSRVVAKAQVEAQDAGLRGADAEAFVQKRMSDAFDPQTGAGLDEDALLYAQQATFTQPLGSSGFGSSVQVFANRSPWLRLVLPFVKTPANVLSDWWQRSPLHYQNYLDLSAGGERRAQAAARLTMGAAYYTAAATLVGNGLITGMGPQDPETKKLWKAAGNQPYSIKVGDKWVSYNRMDPFGMFFGVAADVSEVATHTDDRSAEDLMQMALMAFSRNLSNKTYLRGLADVMDALFERGPQVDQKVERLMQSYAGGFVPFSGYLGNIRNDPYMREVRSMADAVANRVPGFSAELDPQRNILGEITMASEVSGVSPWAVTSDRNEPLAAELARIFESTGEQMQKPPKKTGKVDWTSYKNEKGRSAYDRFLQLHAELGLRDAMTTLMKQPGWQLLSDSGRVEYFRAVQSRIRSAARLTLFKEFPELRDAVMEQERQQRLGNLRAPSQ